MNWNMALWLRRILPAESQEETRKSLRTHGWNNKQIISGDCCVETGDMYVWETIKKRQGIQRRAIFMLKRMQSCKQREGHGHRRRRKDLFFLSEGVPGTLLTGYCF
jgi:hypothetical protein